MISFTFKINNSSSYPHWIYILCSDGNMSALSNYCNISIAFDLTYSFLRNIFTSINSCFIQGDHLSWPTCQITNRFWQRKKGIQKDTQIHQRDNKSNLNVLETIYKQSQMKHQSINMINAINVTSWDDNPEQVIIAFAPHHHHNCLHLNLFRNKKKMSLYFVTIPKNLQWVTKFYNTRIRFLPW